MGIVESGDAVDSLWIRWAFCHLDLGQLSLIIVGFAHNELVW